MTSASEYWYDGFLLAMTFHEGGTWNTYYFLTMEDAADYRDCHGGWHTALISKVHCFRTKDGARTGWLTDWKDRE